MISRIYIGMKFLEKLRKEEGLSQYAMAKELGMIRQSYQHLEERGKGMKLEKLVKVRRLMEQRRGSFSWKKLGKLIDDEVDGKL